MISAYDVSSTKTFPCKYLQTQSISMPFGFESWNRIDLKPSSRKSRGGQATKKPESTRECKTIRIGLLIVRIDKSKIKRFIRAERAEACLPVANIQPFCTCGSAYIFICRFICCGQSDGGSMKRKCCNRRGEEVEFLTVSLSKSGVNDVDGKNVQGRQDNTETPNVICYWTIVVKSSY